VVGTSTAYYCVMQPVHNLTSEFLLSPGGSSGSALSCAIKAIKDADLKEGQRCVVILPDGVRNYMTKFLNDQWMAERGFLPEKNLSTQYWWWNTTVSYLKLQAPLTVLPEVKVQDAIDIMKRKGFDQMPVVDRRGFVFQIYSIISMHFSVEL